MAKKFATGDFLFNVNKNTTKQALALQPAVGGISCLVLLPSFCNDSSLYPSFSNNTGCSKINETH